MDIQADQAENVHPDESSTGHSDDKVELVEVIPVEVWVKIFEFAGSQDENWKWIEKNRALAKLRRVCKKWCNIVDENIDFYISFTDRVLQEKITNHLRINRCSMYGITAHLPSKPILFREPTLLTDVSIHGNITRENFIWLITQLPNWNCLRMGEKFFECDDIFNPSKNPEEDSILQNYWSRLEQLHLECVHANFSDKSNAKAFMNLQRLITIPMPGLKHFRFVVRWNVEMFRFTIDFLLKKPTVKNVEVSCIRIDGSVASTKVYHVAPEEFQRIQLKTLTLQVFHLSPIECAAFLPLVKSQNSLVKLEIKDTCSYHNSSDSLCYGDTLLQVIRNNHCSLTSLNLFAGHAADLVDAKMFQNMLLLKTLILNAEHGPRISYIRNLVCMPASIETLKLENFNHDVHDFLDMCKPDIMPNLRRFSLSPCTLEIQITPDALDNLILRKNLRDLELSSIVMEIFEFETKNNVEEYEEDETFLITTKGFIVPVQEMWNKNDYHLGDIQVDCKNLVKEAKY